MTAKEIRILARCSQTAAAAIVPCSPNTWRLYEANPGAVTAEVRARCDSAVETMRARIEKAAA